LKYILKVIDPTLVLRGPTSKGRGRSGRGGKRGDGGQGMGGGRGECVL